MIITSADAVVAEYLAVVRAELADLPATEVEEILEDIGAHLAEVAAELGEDVSVEALTERLGSPEQYASELRTAAGYPAARPVGSGPTGWAATGYRLALLVALAGVGMALLLGLFQDTFTLPYVTSVVALLFAAPLVAGVVGRLVPGVADLPEVAAGRRAGRSLTAALPPAVVGYLRTLRPGWGLARLIVLAALAVVLISRGDKLWQPAVVDLVLLLWLGFWSEGGRRWRWLLVMANAFAIGSVVALIVAVNLPSRDQEPLFTNEYFSNGLTYNGQPVRNLYVFDKDGKFVPQAHLYDENGNPLRVDSYDCEGPSEWLDTFPLPQVSYGPNGQCTRAVPTPRFNVVVPTVPAPPGK
jgi:uncharacterized membrane protein